MRYLYLVLSTFAEEGLPARPHVVHMEVVRQLAGRAGIFARVQGALQPPH